MGIQRQHKAIARKRGNNVTLIGMPGSGKSTMARLCSRYLQRPFVDTDHILCELANCASTGELSYRTNRVEYMEVEESAVRSIPIDTQDHIIATGGSVVYSPRAIRHLQKLGAIIYIDVEFEILENRVGDLVKRGVLLAEGQSFKSLYDERHILYKRYADMEFTPGELDVRTSVRLLSALISYIEDGRRRLYAEEKNSRN